jgi:hypothetical protein
MRDALGFKIATYEDYNGVFFTLENGDLVGKKEGWIADFANVDLMMAQAPMKEPEDMMWMPMEEKDIIEYLQNKGFGIDTNMRIHFKLNPPFGSLSPQSAALAIMGHVKFCDDEIKRSPEQIPLLLSVNPNDKDQVGLMFEHPEKGPGMMPLPPNSELKDMPDPAQICLTENNKQVCFKWHDYILVPKNPVSGSIYKYMIVHETGASSLEELTEGGRKFINQEGVLLESGAGKLVVKGISIDDFM